MQEIIIYIALLIVGLVIGMVIAKASFSSDRQSQHQTVKAEQEQVMLAQLRNQLSAAKESMLVVESQTAQLQDQLTEFDYILSSYEKQEEQPKITFFGEHASPYLRMKDQSKREKTNTESQPRDFSSSSSGLFNGVEK